jgi:hypothetical protein
MSQREYVLHEHALRAEGRALFWRRACLAVVIVFITLAAAHNGSRDFADSVDLWSEQRIARAARARQDPAVIWSKRCERRDMDVLVKRADKKPLEIHCVPRRVLQVPA